MNNINELITIGIPFFNVEKYLDFAILSVINQSYKNWKLILTDDGSTDSSIDIAKKYLYDKRIRLIVDGKNKGLIFRLNQQIEMAESKYFARMDADDIMHPQRIEKQVCFLEENPNVDIIGSYAYSIDTKNNIHGLLIKKIHPCTLNDAFNHKCFIHPSVIAKIEWFKTNSYDAKYVRMEDTELWVRTIKQSNFVNLNIPLLFYRDVGVPYLKKYLQSTKGERYLIRNTFTCFISIVRWQLLFKNYTKLLLYIIFSIFHLQNLLIKRRALYIDDIEKQNATVILNEAILCKKEIY